MEIKRYVKRPVQVGAVQFTPRDPNWDWNKLSEFFGIKSGNGLWQAFGSYVLISTLEGEMRVNEGDWIIKGVNGEFYPCKPDIFEKTYREIDT